MSDLIYKALNSLIIDFAFIYQLKERHAFLN